MPSSAAARSPARPTRARASPRPPRCRRHRHLERHRRRDFLRPRPGRAARPAARRDDWCVARRWGSGVRRRDGVRGARRAAAACRRRVCLPARGVRTAGRVPDGMDVVRGGVLRGDCGQRGCARGLRRPLHSRGRRHAAGLLVPPALAERDASIHRRADGDRHADRHPCPRPGSGTPRPERAGGDQGQRDRAARRARLRDRSRQHRELRRAGRRRAGCVPAGAGSSDVQLLGLERRRVRR